MYSTSRQSLDKLQARNDECSHMHSRSPNSDDTSMKFFWKCSTRCLFLIGALSLCLFVSMPISQNGTRRRLNEFSNQKLRKAVQKIEKMLKKRKTDDEFLDDLFKKISKAESNCKTKKDNTEFQKLKDQFDLYYTLAKYSRRFPNEEAAAPFTLFDEREKYSVREVAHEFLKELEVFPLKMYYPFRGTMKDGTAFEVAKLVKKISNRRLGEWHDRIVLQIIRNNELGLDGDVRGYLKTCLRDSRTMISSINKVRQLRDSEARWQRINMFGTCSTTVVAQKKDVVPVRKVWKAEPARYMQPIQLAKPVVHGVAAFETSVAVPTGDDSEKAEVEAELLDDFDEHIINTLKQLIGHKNWSRDAVTKQLYEKIPKLNELKTDVDEDTFSWWFDSLFDRARESVPNTSEIVD